MKQVIQIVIINNYNYLIDLKLLMYIRFMTENQKESHGTTTPETAENETE